MSWSRHLRHRLRPHEHRLRVVGDALLILAVVSMLGLVVAVLLARY